VIPTVILDPATAFAAGTLIAIASHRVIVARREAELDRVVLLGAAWGLWYGVCVAYYFFVFGDWWMVYLQDSSQIYKPVALLFFLFIMVGCGAAGAASSGWFLLRGRRNLAMAVSSTGLIALASIFRITWSQYTSLGTREEFLKGAAVPLTDVHPFQVATIVIGILSAAPFIAICAWQIWIGRKVPAAPAKA
jgi:hypothetical protein